MATGSQSVASFVRKEGRYTPCPVPAELAGTPGGVAPSRTPVRPSGSHVAPRAPGPAPDLAGAVR